MTTSAFNATVVYIQDSQSPAEKRLALNLMINMLSQNTDKSGKTLLDQNVHRIAEVLVIMQTSQIENNCCNWSNAMKMRVWQILWKKTWCKIIRRHFTGIPNSKRQIDVETNSEIKICGTDERLWIRFGVRSRCTTSGSSPPRIS